MPSDTGAAPHESRGLRCRCIAILVEDNAGLLRNALLSNGTGLTLLKDNRAFFADEGPARPRSMRGLTPHQDRINRVLENHWVLALAWYRDAFPPYVVFVPAQPFHLPLAFP